MALLEIKTADELIDPALEARWTARRTSRQTDVFQRILRAFVDGGGPIPVEYIVGGVRGAAADVHDALAALDADDLIFVRDGRVDIAYPFSAAPTPFAVRLSGGAERYACCAIDALGIAPMAGARVEIRARCHHCGTPLEFSAAPTGPGPEADGVMLWVGTPAEDRSRVADSL
jgi:hypothetical protein